jgi:hypothetical protein
MKNIEKNAIRDKGKGTIGILCGIVLLSVLFTVGGCNKLNRIDLEGIDLDAIKSKCDKNVIICQNEFANAPNDWLSIIDIKIVNNCLKIKFAASGCDGNFWVVELIGLGNYDKSNPPQTTLRLSLDNKEMCATVITKEISFNLEPLIEYLGYDRTKQLIIHVSGKSIIYER